MLKICYFEIIKYDDCYYTQMWLKLDYVTIRLPIGLGDKLDAYFDKNKGEYYSRTDVVRYILKKFFDDRGL